MDNPLINALDFDAILAVAETRGYVVEELSIGELAVKLSRRDANPVTERKDKDEPATTRSALDMLNDPRHADEGDVVTMPKGFEGATPAGPSTPVQWATDDPHQGEVMPDSTPPATPCRPRAQGRTQDARCRADVQRRRWRARRRPSDVMDVNPTPRAAKNPDAPDPTRQYVEPYKSSSGPAHLVGEDLALRGRWRRPADRQAPG